MKQIRLSLLLAILLLAGTSSAQKKTIKTLDIQTVTTNSKVVNGTAKIYANPVISGFNPDPSICKVGKDFYLVTSSFEYFPGVPVYHSTDLVNWEMIGHVLDRPSQLNLDSAKSSGGIFAPCIRYNKGTFYMVTTLVKNGGDFICTATNPAGPWSEPHFIKGAPGIDPDLFFDDNGKVYMSGTATPTKKIWKGHNAIWTQEIDLEKWEFVGEKHINCDAGDYYNTINPLKANSVNNLGAMEGPHIYKKDGTYYFTCSIGGTGINHAFIILRSNNVFGPWEMNPNNPILTHRDLPANHPIVATGHADLVQIQNGDWAIVYLGKRTIQDGNSRSRVILGRETFMSTVDWSGEWPIVNTKGLVGRSELVQEKPNLAEAPAVDKSYLMEDFNGVKLHPQWTFLRTPRTEWWSLTDRKGFLRLKLRPEMIDQIANPSLVCKRQEHADFTVTTKMDFNPTGENEEAGIVITKQMDCYLKYTVKFENKKIVLKVSMRDSKTSADSVLAKVRVSKGNIYLKMDVKGLIHSFSYSENGVKWKSLLQDNDLSDTQLVFGYRFTGSMVGMYASSNGKSSNTYVDFDNFYYTNQ
jgi:alpha-N-arabinofuranosidase